MEIKKELKEGLKFAVKINFYLITILACLKILGAW